MNSARLKQVSFYCSFVCIALLAILNSAVVMATPPNYLAKVQRTFNTLDPVNGNITNNDTIWLESDDGYLFTTQDVAGAGIIGGGGHRMYAYYQFTFYVKGNPNGNRPWRLTRNYTGLLSGSKATTNYRYNVVFGASSSGFSGCPKTVVTGDSFQTCSGSSPAVVSSQLPIVYSSTSSGTTNNVANSTPYSGGGINYYAVNSTTIKRHLEEERNRTNTNAGTSGTDPQNTGSAELSFFLTTSDLPDRKRSPGNTAGPNRRFYCSGAGNGGSGGTGNPNWLGSGSSSNEEKLVQISNNIATGNIQVSMNDPVPTRGYPLRNRIHLNSQVVDTQRPMGNATFSYDIYVTTQTLPLAGGGGNASHWILVDGDGQRLNFGSEASAPTPEPGVFSTLTETMTGFELTNAGPPEELRKAGNYNYIFDSNGNLTSLIDPAGNEQTLSYSSGKLTSVLDVNSDKEITYSYTGDRITQVTENEGGADTYITYSSDKVTKIELKQSSTVNFTLDITYDGSNRLKTIKRDGIADSTYTFAYTTQGSVEPSATVNLASTISWSEGNVQPVYNLDSPTAATRTAFKDSNNSVTYYDFDAEWNLNKVTFPSVTGATQPVAYSYTYDSDKNIASASDGSVTINYTYNANGTLDEVTYPGGYYKQFNYNGVNLTSVEDQIGVIQTYTYGNMSLPNLPTIVEDALSNEWSYTYNAYGQVTEVAPPTGSPLGSTTYTYDEDSMSSSYGWLKEIEDGAGNLLTYDSYDLLGNVTSLSSYVDPLTPATQTTTTFTYDAVHRLKVLTHPDSKTITNSYDGGALDYTDDEASKRTNYTWCLDCGGLSGISRPLSWSVSFLRGDNHQVETYKDARGNDTTYSYGLASELVEVNYPDGTSEEFSYDNSARLKRIINGRSEESEMDYDALGRINELSFPTTSDPTINYTFRGDSLPDVTTDGVGEVSYEYYSNRWLKAVNYDYSNTGLTNVQRVEYTYHPDGSLDSIIWKDDTTTVATWSYDYDQAGRMTSVSSFGETSNFSYDGQDNLLSQVNHNGTETTYTYNNDRNWPTNIIHDDGSSSFAEYDITYDGGYNTVGNITRVDENVNDYITYGYDDLYRLTSETRTGSGSYTNTFTYDLAGNLTNLNGSAYAGYDAGNKISSITSGSITNDNDGNITAVSAPGLSSRTMGWDSRSKMISHTSGGVTVEYGYDGYGKRVWSQVDSDPKTFYIFAGDLLIGEISGGSQLPTAAYTWGADGLVSQRDIQGTETYWYHFGPQGETRFLTDDTATVVNTYVYDAYGITLSSSGSVPNPFRYGGRYGYYTDDDTSLMLAGARWYSPQLKRWISRDPIRYEGGQNLYEYVMQNPVNYYDQLGLAPVYNNAKIPLPYKHENDEFLPPRMCKPGSFCNADGIYPPSRQKGCYPVKIPNNCTGYISDKGQLNIWCIPWGDHKPRMLTDDDFTKPEFQNWPKPSDVYK